IGSNGSNTIIRVNKTGQSLTGDTATYFGSVVSPSSQPQSRIGARYRFGAIESYFTGDLDEIRLTSVVLSDAWHDAEYDNQNDPATFYTIGAQETESTPTGSVTHIK